MWRASAVPSTETRARQPGYGWPPVERERGEQHDPEASREAELRRPPFGGPAVAWRL